jgi:hypothetical protein
MLISGGKFGGNRASIYKHKAPGLSQGRSFGFLPAKVCGGGGHDQTTDESEQETHHQSGQRKCYRQ